MISALEILDRKSNTRAIVSAACLRRFGKGLWRVAEGVGFEVESSVVQRIEGFRRRWKREEEGEASGI